MHAHARVCAYVRARACVRVHVCVCVCVRRERERGRKEGRRKAGPTSPGRSSQGRQPKRARAHTPSHTQRGIHRTLCRMHPIFAAVRTNLCGRTRLRPRYAPAATRRRGPIARANKCEFRPAAVSPSRSPSPSAPPGAPPSPRLRTRPCPPHPARLARARAPRQRRRWRARRDGRSRGARPLPCRRRAPPLPPS